MRVEWLRDCASWLAQLELGEYPPVINLRPEPTHPDRCSIVVDVGRVRRVLLRMAADIDELARVRSVEDLDHAQVDGDVRAERRRRLAESPLAFPRTVAASASPAERRMSSRRSAGAAGRPTHTRSTAAATRRRNGWLPGPAVAHGSAGVHQSERLSAHFRSTATPTPSADMRVALPKHGRAPTGEPVAATRKEGRKEE